MKKVMLMAIVALFSAASVFAAHSTNAVADTTKTKKVKPAAKIEYTCPMHADVVLDKPGKCPKCSMALVKKEAAKKPAMKM
jgi:hypothetical protein